MKPEGSLVGTQALKPRFPGAEAGGFQQDLLPRRKRKALLGRDDRSEEWLCHGETNTQRTAERKAAAKNMVRLYR